MTGITKYALNGVDVTIEHPCVVSEGFGHKWFPRISRFDSGTLLLTNSIAPDRSDLLVSGGAIHYSFDGAASWPLRWDSSEGASVTIPLEDGSIGGPSFAVYWTEGESKRQFRTHYSRLTADGKRQEIEPWGAEISGLPRDVTVFQVPGQHGHTSKGALVFHGDPVQTNDGVITTVYLTYDGDDGYSTIAVVSRDEGRTWEYLSQIAGPNDLPVSKEGPCEPSMIRLANGGILCALRVGGGTDMPLWRSWSYDEGRTWTAVDTFPAFGVDPTLLRTSSDTLVLVSGRPGIKLWISTDPEGREWESIDLIAHHNASFDDEHHTITPLIDPNRAERHAGDQTTAYTGAVETEPDRVVIAYDRIPFGWNPVPVDSTERSRIYTVELNINRR